MSEWLSLMQMKQITLIPEDCDPIEVQKIADIGWFSILVAGKLYAENQSLGSREFVSRVKEDIRDSYIGLGLSDRLDWDFCVRLTWVCYETMVAPTPRKNLPSAKGAPCWCGEDAEELDHLWPLSHGGPPHPEHYLAGTRDHWWNFMPTCMFHNRQKAATPMLIYKEGFLDDLRKYIFERTRGVIV